MSECIQFSDEIMQPERRRYARIRYPMPVKVQGGDFEFETVVDDLGAGGIRSRSMRKISMGEKLRFQVKFTIAGSRPKVTPKISARGIVTRVCDLRDGSFEFAAKFTQFRFL